MRHINPISRSQLAKALLLSGVGSLFLFVWVTWPLVNFWSQGIPSSSQNIEHPAWRNTIPGDHLQLLYHFDLVADMFSGRIDWMTNPYEFNTGDESARFIPGSYFFPMSGVYAGLKAVVGQSAAWNTTLWISVWASAFFTWLWLRRFTTQTGPLLLGIVLTMLPPVRWISLLGGSPAGIALMYIPLYALSIDLAVRNPKARHGFFIGLCLLLLFWADLQVFYFSVLTTPVFVLISLSTAGKAAFANWKTWMKCLPGIFLFAAFIGVFYIWRKQHLAGSAMEGGRGLEELALYSPLKRSFWIQGPGKEGMVYLGWGTLVALLMGSVSACTTFRQRVREDWVKTASFTAFILALVFCCFLAVGIHGPFEAAPIRLTRNLAPYFDMIRQPAKIMAVIPLWISWLLACSWSIPFKRGFEKYRRPAIAFVCLWIILGFQDYVSTTLSLNPESQEAYALVESDAKSMGIENPRLLVIPLWPGESAETSVPMYFAQKYHLRLLNGYSPVVSEAYIKDFVEALESINMGWLTTAQIKKLKNIGLHHLVVHENMFPEKVSPFPITETLQRLHHHPQLEFMIQAGSVHAFRILDIPVKKEPSRGVSAFPSRVWRFHPETQETARYKLPPSPESVAWFRVKGAGDLNLDLLLDEEQQQVLQKTVSTTEWSWVQFPLIELPRFGQVYFKRNGISEALEIDQGLIVKGDWSERIPETGISIPASAFFHAGHVEPDGTSVRMRRSYEPDTIIFYGPRLPLEKGNYQISLSYSLVDAKAYEGIELGAIRIRSAGQPDSEWVPIFSGQTARFEWKAESNHPVDIQFSYTREEDMILERVGLSPLGDSK